MNVRLYDPVIHRFLQVDNYIQDPANTQNYNQYGYVLNNPLLYTDPSGNTYGNNGKDCVNCWDETKDQIGGGVFKSLADFFKDGRNAAWFKRNAGEAGRFVGRNAQDAANYVGRNIESGLRDVGKFLGFGGGDGPPPNLSSYVNLNTATNFGQGFGKMAIQTVIDGFDTISPGFSHMFDSLGGTDYLGIRPTDSQKAGYYTAMAITFLSPGGAEVKVEQYTLRAVESGFYPVMKRGFRKAQELVWLEKDEIWKFGTTRNPLTRYLQKYLKNRGEKGLYYFREFEGTLSEALQLERMKIMNYFEQWGFLPAGNKIRK